jgi:hypothetical protein
MSVRKFLRAVLAAGVLAGPAVSHAGIIIIVGKQGQPIPDLDGNPRVLKVVDVQMAPVAAVAARAMMMQGFENDPMLLKQIEDGVVTSDEAASGCGGNAAAGPAAGLPLALAALSLVLRRRRS